MRTLFTTEAISDGGRSGTLQSRSGLLNITLGNPLEPDIAKRGPNPELLFAGAYAACYHGALTNAGNRLGTLIGTSTARALVSLIEDDQGGFRLALELRAYLPGIIRHQSGSRAAHHGRGAPHLSCGCPHDPHETVFAVMLTAKENQQQEGRIGMTTLEIKGDWNITKGKLKQKWAQLTDDDLKYAEGRQEELLGRIQKRTGETREAVERAIKDSCSNCGCN